MYTLYPLQDYIDSHIGLGIIYAFLAIIFLACVGFAAEYHSHEPKVAFSIIGISGVILIVLAIVSHVISHNHDDSVYRKNEQVIAQKVTEFEAATSERHGKRNVTVPSMHVTYKLPNGETVNFRMSDGQVYPDQVILYKNP